jgi:oligosaccharyltransferase complex subunit epsilon
MAKKNARDPAPSAAATTQASTTATGSVPPAATTTTTTTATPRPVLAKAAGVASWDKVLQNIYDYYMKETPQRTKLIDVFLAFIAVVGALQFVYCILAGNYVSSPPHGNPCPPVK